MNIKVKGRWKSVLQVDENKDRLFRARGSDCEEGWFRRWWA
jgi:hypothetical protein